MDSNLAGASFPVSTLEIGVTYPVRNTAVITGFYGYGFLRVFPGFWPVRNTAVNYGFLRVFKMP